MAVFRTEYRLDVFMKRIVLLVGGVETLAYFSIQMGNEWKRMGYKVFYFDLEDERNSAKKLRRFIKPGETVLVTFTGRYSLCICNGRLSGNPCKRSSDIDMDLVDAQQARRELDRMVGYKISPLLWAKVKRGLSAGRVQSVALRIVADREAEIDAFIPEEYWSLDAQLKVKGEKRPLTAKFYGTEKKKMTIHSKEEMDEILKKLENEEFQIIDIKNSERTRKAPLPFTTSTLQQEAAKALNFGTQKTMRIAQQLYEGVDIKGNGTVGVITYLRTDSTRISEEADAAARSYIAETYGEAYVAEGTKTKSADKKIQDAHEAIRPTDITRTPAAIKDSLSRDQFRLYQLIWKRFTASRMQPAKYETTAVKIGIPVRHTQAEKTLH